MTADKNSGNRRMPAGRRVRAVKACLLGLGLTVLMPLQGVAAQTRIDAPAPGRTAAAAEAATARLVLTLAAAREPAVGFGRLARADQQAVVRFLSVASTGRPGRSMAVRSPAAAGRR